MDLDEMVEAKGIGLDGVARDVFVRINSNAKPVTFHDYTMFEKYTVEPGGALLFSLMGTALGTLDADQVAERIKVV